MVFFILGFTLDLYNIPSSFPISGGTDGGYNMSFSKIWDQKVSSQQSKHDDDLVVGRKATPPFRNGQTQNRIDQDLHKSQRQRPVDVQLLPTVQAIQSKIDLRYLIALAIDPLF
jgi:hypothetical protein